MGECEASSRLSETMSGLSDLETYVCGQPDIITDYATARRRKEPISTAVTERGAVAAAPPFECPAANAVVAPRPLMLKVQCAVMNGTLETITPPKLRLVVLAGERHDPRI